MLDIEKKKLVNGGALESAFTTLKGYIDQLSARVDALERIVTMPDDLAGTTWMMNSTLDLLEYGTSYDIDFNVPGFSEDFTELSFSKYSEPPSYFDADALAIRSDQGGGVGYYIYDDVSHWYVPEQRYMSITGGADATNTSLIEWLFDNAKQVLSVPTE